jgi:predicted nucleotidyltransferase
MTRRTFGDPLTARSDVERCTILRCVVGSSAHGLHLNDGLEDRDEMGICIEPMEAAMGSAAPFEQFIYRSAAEREGRHDASSIGGDLDLVVYSLRKYVRLALGGNPTVLMVLFAPDVVQSDARGWQLRELAPAFASRVAGKKFLGYLSSQRQRMLGERGNAGHGRPRDELVQKFGYDVKFAMHMLRLGYQGIEYLQTGKLTMPMAEPERAYLFDVRQGKFDMQHVLTRAGELERELKDLLDTSPLPLEPDITAVDDWMIRMYIRAWSAARMSRDIAEDAARHAATS